ncbi:beta-glucosidase [Massilia sp. S19_KUP03_FR1]|uniref:beta-glucosidase n=1 Tax=Massilia sp. S19_KUP03_FR1 TaxID=3025503 RepID=UPI002FCCCAE4
MTYAFAPSRTTLARTSVLVLTLGAMAVASAYDVTPRATPMVGNDVDARVGAMIDNMSTAEKIEFIRVDDGRMLPLQQAQGLPGTVAYDSSMGINKNSATFGAQFPSPSALAATWSINRAKQFGLAIAYETRQAGAQQMLTPGLNMYRSPYNGRAAEHLSGEDPFLGAVLGPAVVNAVQAQGIQASAKHYVANEQEANRQLINVKVDERTLREIYLPGFESVVKNANVASIMCGFNKVNAEYACENHHLITEVLKGEWGYRGFVMSDFNAIHNGQKGAWAGTDLDMPSGLQFTQANIWNYLYSNQLTMNVLDDKVRRNLRAMVSYGFDKGLTPGGELDRSYGAAASLAIAREGIVLLKNADASSASRHVLPLATNAKIAVIGDIAMQLPGSPFGTAWSPPSQYVTTMAGLQQLNVDPANIVYIPALSLNAAESSWYQGAASGNSAPEAGLKAEYFDNTTLAGTPVLTRTEPGVAFNWLSGMNITNNGTTRVDGFAPNLGAFSARFSGTIKPTVDGEQVFKVRADGAYKVWVDGKLVVDFDGLALSGDVVNAPSRFGKTAKLKADKYYTVKMEYARLGTFFFPVLGSIQGIQMSWAALAAPADLAQYDAVVVAVGVNAEYEGEGFDREFDLPEYQAEMVASVAKTNPNTIVIAHGGGPSNLRPFASRAGAILQAWYAGQYAGQAEAEIIYGKVNPSGKLPVTIAKNESDYPSYASYNSVAAYQPAGLFGAAPTRAKLEMTYSEGIYTGYRGFDKSNTKPLFPFGFGLSYTSYTYSDMTLSSNTLAGAETIEASFTLTNSGAVDGFEVAQLYVSPAVTSKVDRPEKELKGFAKVFLKAGASKRVTIPIDARSLSYYVQNTDTFNVDKASYTIRVGGASDALPLKQVLKASVAQKLSTNASNPLPLPVRQAVQVPESMKY